jgi:hypothetical protein
MIAKRVFTYGLAFGLAAVVAQAQDQTKPIFMPAADLRWSDLDPTGAPGIKIVDVWGDHTQGAYGAFLKFPAGFVSPNHTHTDAIKIVVISGTYTQLPEVGRQARLGPGSYAYQPGGDYKHVSGCDKASECVLYIESAGKFDLLPVAASSAPK